VESDQKRIQADQPNPIGTRQKAVTLRLAGETLAKVTKQTGLSAPTVTALVKVFKQGGWEAITRRAVGRPKGGSKTGHKQLVDLKSVFLSDQTRIVLNTKSLAVWFAEQTKSEANERVAIRRLADWQLLPPNATNQAGHFYPTPQTAMLWARGPKAEVYLQVCPLPMLDADYLRLVQAMHKYHPKGFALAFKGEEFAGIRFTPKLAQYLAAHSEISFAQTSNPNKPNRIATYSAMQTKTKENATIVIETKFDMQSLTHLQRLEAEAIHIMREVVAEAENPVMLYSMGKDSTVMLRLALKAFAPAKIPFPLLHIDSTWEFREMYAFSKWIQKEHDLKLISHVNEEGLAKGINPFTHGSQIHTDILRTEGLKQALDKYKFDVAFGGGRRDEEKSRAKERLFSFRTNNHRWDPKDQRPELWSLYNTKKHKGESIRVFPISNWTELDIWQYIYLESIPIVPLYFSAPRPVVNRDGTLIMVDDDRMPLSSGEVPMIKSVRFRTLGCYPLTGAVESTAASLEDIIQEMLLTKTSERQGRVIDHDSAASMEKKKQEGYF